MPDIESFLKDTWFSSRIRRWIRWDCVLVTRCVRAFFSILLGGVSFHVRGEIQASVIPGWLLSPTQVVFHAAFPDDRLRFTTNGSVPTLENSRELNAPLFLNHSAVVRVSAFRESALPSAVQTFTYLFGEDVLHQTGAGYPLQWGVTNGAPVKADYAMDPRMVGEGNASAELLVGLQGLPVVSLVADLSDWFDSKHGVYSNPMSAGPEWERPASVEIQALAGSNPVQVNCGIRIQGGWNRRPEESPKHALRLVFRRHYGPGELRMDLFGGGVQRFETLILRAGCNNSWLHWSGEERARGDYIRDQWMRDSYAAMGHLSARGKFVHLFLNGLYWGLYNLVERPSAPFVASNLGGKASEYDSRNGENILEGDDVAWRTLFGIANAGAKDSESFRRIEALLNIEAFADYMLLNLYGANGDWDRGSNWYAARRRVRGGQFVFFVWDGERTLEKVDDSILAADDDFSPTRLFQRLRENPEFRKRFSDRARLHLRTDGVLGPKAAAARYQVWAQTLDKPILAESARWGDYRHDVHPYKVGPYEVYTRERHWRPEVKRLLEDYFPKRTARLIEQLSQVGLYE